MLDARRKAAGLAAGSTDDADAATDDADIEDTENDEETTDAVETKTETKKDSSDVGIDIDSKYLTTDGSVVYVEYANGVRFVINFNSFDVTADLDDGTSVEIKSLGYVRIEA